MTAQEYLATIKRPLTDIERNCVVEAWEAAQNDCQKDIEGWTASAYEDGALSMEAKSEQIFAEMSKYRTALDAILNVNHSTLTEENKIFRIFEIAKEALKRGAL